LVVSASIFGAAFGASPEAQAATITVNTTSDQYGTGSECSLREAITTANGDAPFGGCTPGGTGADTITVPAGTYTLTRNGTDEDANLNGDLDITEDLIIAGGGARATVVDGNRTVTLEQVFATPPPGIAVTIQDVTIRNGAGGILNPQMTTTVNLRRVTVSGNQGGAGGAVNNFGILNIDDATLSGNVAPGGASGGALRVSGPTTLTNVTISGNSATDFGGAIYADDSLTMNNVTISDNVADSDADGSGNGGGVYVAAGTTSLRNSILGNNQDKSTGSDPNHPDCSGTVVSEGYNLIGDTAGCTVSGNLTGNLTGTDPQLFQLADNGGPTDTHALKQASPAIDAGNPAAPGSGGDACAGTDQRGLPRAGSRCDIGAYELVQCLGVDVTVIGTDGPDALTGTAKGDGILAFGGNDVVSSGGGKDAVCAGDGDDVVSGGDADDEVVGESGNDRLKGDAGNDSLSGQAANDRLIGAGGNDLLRGQGARDRLKGKGGDDTLKGGPKPDSLNGGGGVDTCRGGGGRDRVRRCE
jgi:CSLREA domain-containing protein